MEINNPLGVILGRVKNDENFCSQRFELLDVGKELQTEIDVLQAEGLKRLYRSMRI